MSFMSNHVIHVKSCHSCQIMSFMSNHVIHVKSCHSCHSSQIMSFISNHVIHLKSSQIMSFISNHVMHLKSCHASQIMSFMSNHVIHVKSYHSGQIIYFFCTCRIGFFIMYCVLFCIVVSKQLFALLRLTFRNVHFSKCNRARPSTVKKLFMSRIVRRLARERVA
jgi:hypothetical protein